MNKMEKEFRYKKLEELIVRDHNFIFTIFSFFLILIIYLNLSFTSSPVIGTAASLAFFMINGIFLGRAFFEKEAPFFRLMFGALLLIMLLGFVGWLAVIIYNLDVIRFTLVLFIAATLSSLLNRMVKTKNVT
jgi:hypothetical protein